MARIRTIKPEFWTDGDVMDLTPFARLLFIGSWNFALCDFGHVADDPRRLKMQVLPSDDVDADALVEELIHAGRMVRVTADGRSFLHIKRFTDHQKTERRWTPRCPVCASQKLPEPLPTTPNLSETPPTSAPEGKGREGKGEKPSSKIADAIPDEPTAPRVDVERICRRLAEHVEANGAKRPTVTKAWRDSARLLLDKDGHTEAQVVWLIDWCQRDEFWRSNILSLPKFREKFDQLLLKARPGSPTLRPVDDQGRAVLPPLPSKSPFWEA